MKRAQRHSGRSISTKRDIKGMQQAARPISESLERRIFLSGNVVAQVVAGNLNITGDASGNVIFLSTTGLGAHRVRVVGDGSTDINGQAGSAILSGVKGDVTIRLNGGADSATLSNMTLPQNLKVAQGGNDSLTLTGVTIPRALSLQNSSSLLPVTTTLDDSSIGKDFALSSGDGVQNIVFDGLQVHGNSAITTGALASTMTIDDSIFRRDIAVTTGAGADAINIETNGSPTGPTTLFDGTVTIAMGAGNDTLQLGVANESGNQAVFANKVHLDGGTGTNTFNNFNATFAAPPLIRNVVSDVAPTVSDTDPADNATNIATNAAIAVTFSEAVDPATVIAANVTLTGPGSTPVAGVVTLVGTTATFTPTSNLAANTTYTGTISTGVKDLAGNPLASNFVWSFTTGVGTDVTAPTVSSVDPDDNQTAVSLNKAITATFSEAMAASTINTTNVTVTAGGTPVPGTVALTGTTMTFTPTSLLAASTLFTVTIGTGATDLAGNPLANNVVWHFTTGTTADTTPPTVSSTDPASAATGVTLNKAIAATFSETMNASTISTATYTLKGPGNTAVAGTVTLVGTTATFTPTSLLAANTTFTATISTAAQDLAGNGLAAAKVWTFTTGAGADTTPPTVSSTDPANAATAVTLNKAIAATFSESMDSSTISTATYTLKGPGNTPVAGSVTLVGTTATFTPTSNLAANTTFTATISTAATDLAGNPLAVAKTWTFTTGAAADTTPPTVSSTDPANAATAVTLNKAIAATFSESMDASTISTATYTLTGPGSTPVAGSVTLVGTTATFTPTSNLAANTTFTATISTGATDLAGNPLAVAKVWTFTTGAAADTTPPTVTGNVPADNATGVAVNQAITGTFSEAMAAATINTTNITVSAGGTPVSGAVTLSGTTMTFTPTSALAANTLFTVTIGTGVTDLAGNHLAADAVWHFTTGAAPDTTPPTVASTDPADTATGVTLTQAVAATFSEAMAAGTISTATFTLTGPGSTPVAGTVTLSGNTATFTPNANLAASTTFTATISTGATDLAGNPLAAAKVWTFTTGTAPDTTPPTVASTAPVDNGTNVSVNSPIQIDFSEAMDASTITATTITVSEGGAPVAGTVTYNASNDLATFTPSAPLDPATTFDVTVVGGVNGVTDVAGNPLAADFNFSFTTT